MKFHRAAVVLSQTFLFLASRSQAFVVPQSSHKSWSLASTVTSAEIFAATTEKVTSGIDASESVPEPMKTPLKHFITEYMTACLAANEDGNDDVTADVAAKNILSAIEFGSKYGLGPDKYQFETAHQALREPFDYYRWGCNFFFPIMAKQSVFRGKDILETIETQLANGENVVFLANHQSEADPQVVSYAFEQLGHGKLAEDMIYVAGHKVTTDPLAIPFSMGRNLLCIHSKKHIDADPETKGLKQKQNLATMSHMQNLLKEGGKCIWVAPSGGRDRRNTETGEVPLAQFDQKTIDLFRLLGAKSKKETHFYVMAMVSYDLCPPPDFVTKDVGELRNVRYSPIGVSLSGVEIENIGGAESRHLFTERAMETTVKLYENLLEELSSSQS